MTLLDDFSRDTNRWEEVIASPTREFCGVIGAAATRDLRRSLRQSIPFLGRDAIPDHPRHATALLANDLKSVLQPDPTIFIFHPDTGSDGHPLLAMELAEIMSEFRRARMRESGYMDQVWPLTDTNHPVA